MAKNFIRGGFSPFQSFGVNGLGDDPYSNQAADSTGNVTLPISVLNSISTPAPASSNPFSNLTINPLYILGGILFMGIFLSGGGKR